MKTKTERISESMRGKHDYQLKSELRDLFNANGLDPILSVDRRRGRIKVQCDDGDYLLTSSIVRAKHPDFITNSFKNGFVLFTDTIEF